MMEEKCSRGKQPVKLLDKLTKWLKGGRATDALKVTRDSDALKAMIAYSREHATRLIERLDL